MPVLCPECNSALEDLEEEDAEIGDELTCSECGAPLRVASDSPLELEVADEDDLDEDEEDEGGDDDDEFGDEEEDTVDDEE